MQSIHTTITINEQGLFVPTELFQHLGWQLNSKVQVLQNQTNLILSLHSNSTVNTNDHTNLNHITPEQKEKNQALLDKGFGMLTIKPESIPKGSLFDFDVADHITLFDEND